MAEIKNAIIESAVLDIGDRGLLTAWLHLDYGGTGQGFGGYALYLPPSFTHSEPDAPFAGLFIYRVLQVAGVDRWDRLSGRTIRVRAQHTGVDAIGHIIKDDWFCPGAEFEAAKEARQAAQAVKP